MLDPPVEGARIKQPLCRAVGPQWPMIVVLAADVHRHMPWISRDGERSKRHDRQCEYDDSDPQTCLAHRSSQSQQTLSQLVRGGD
jgi:hypothetical protein